MGIANSTHTITMYIRWSHPSSILYYNFHCTMHSAAIGWIPLASLNIPLNYLCDNGPFQGHCDNNSCKEEGAVLHSDLAHCKTNLFHRNATTLTYIQW